MWVVWLRAYFEHVRRMLFSTYSRRTKAQNRTARSELPVSRAPSAFKKVSEVLGPFRCNVFKTLCLRGIGLGFDRRSGRVIFFHRHRFRPWLGRRPPYEGYLRDPPSKRLH